MKIVAILLLCLAISQAMPIFTPQENLSITPAEVEKLLGAFLKGLGLHTVSNSSLECQSELDSVFQVAAIAIQQYEAKQWYVGTLNLTSALGLFSPLSRKCADTGDEIIVLFASFVGQFTSINDFIGKIGFNFMANLKPLKEIAGNIAKEYILNRNMTLIAEMSGQLVYTIIHIPKTQLTFTETNPFAPNPLVDWLWIPFEATYHFLTRSGTVTAESLGQAEGSMANFVLDVEAAVTFQKQKDYRNAFFAYSDALSYLHGAVQGSHDTWFEFSDTWSMINTQVFKVKGAFFKNIKTNFFGIMFNEVPFISAELFYGDWINLFGAFGLTFDKILVKDLVKPE